MPFFLSRDRMSEEDNFPGTRGQSQEWGQGARRAGSCNRATGLPAFLPWGRVRLAWSSPECWPGRGKPRLGGSSGSHGTCLLSELLRVWSPFLEWRGHAGGPSRAGDEGLKVMSVPFSSLRCCPPDRPPCTPLCAGQAEGWGPREGPCPGPVIWNLVRGSEALPGVKVGGILLLSVWPIIGLELWGLRRSDRALGDFCHQGTPFCCHEGRPSPHCPPREGKRPTLRGVRLPVPHLRVVFRPDRRQKQSFPRRAFGATHGAGQSLTEGLGVRDSGTQAPGWPYPVPCS